MKPAINIGAVRETDNYRIANERTETWIESHFTLRAALHGQNILNEHNQRCGRERGYSVYVRKDGSWEIVIPAPDYPRGE